MAKLALNYDIVNETPATAVPVETNFNNVEQYVNQELIERDGSVEMRAQLKLVGDPVNPLDAAPKQYVDSFLPIGIIMMYGGTGAPPGAKWALCNGAELEIVTNQALYDIIGTAYGGTAGRFNLPNLVGRFPVGVSGTIARGTSGGMADAIIPAHTHKIDHNHGSVTTGLQTASHTHTFSDTTSTTSSAGAHDHQFRGAETNAPAGNLGLFLAADISTTAYGIKGKTSSAGSHTHTVAVSGTTGVQSVGHNHGVDLPNFTGSSGPTVPAPAATTVGANMPPYQAVQYIIRIS